MTAASWRCARLVTVVLAVLGALGLAACSGEPRATARPTLSSPPTVAATVADDPVEPRALRVLHVWDARRASAYADGDVTALRRLYAPASCAGRRDVRALREYVGRGLVVRGLRMQVRAVHVAEAARGLLAIVVRDRVASGRVVGRRVRVSLPDDGVSRRRVTFAHTGRGWVVRSVR